MRLSVFIFAAAATLLANTKTVEAAVATTIGVNTIYVAQYNNKGTRSLRTNEAVDNDPDDDSDDEERAGLTELKAKFTESSRLKALLSDVDTFKAQAHELIAINKAQALQLIDSNKELFKQLDMMVGNPYQLHKKLGIAEKIKKLPSAQLASDKDYHLWLEYSKWWKGTYGKDLGV